MAYVPLDDEEERLRQQGGMAAPAPMAMGSAAPGAPAGGGAGPAPAQAAPQQPAGTGFVNLARYFGLNQPGAQSLAQGVQGDVGAATQGFKELGQGWDAMTSLSGPKQEIAAMNAANGVTHPAGAQSMSALPGYQNLQGQVNAAADRNKQAASGGLQSVLAQQHGAKGGYGGGLQRFDTALAGRAGGFSAAADAWNKLGASMGLADKKSAIQAPSGFGPRPDKDPTVDGTTLGGPTTNPAPTPPLPPDVTFGPTGHPEVDPTAIAEGGVRHTPPWHAPATPYAPPVRPVTPAPADRSGWAQLAQDFGLEPDPEDRRGRRR